MKIRIWLNIFCIFVIWINCSDWIHKLIIKYIIFRVWSRVSILLLIFTKFSFLQLGYRLQKSFDIFVPFLILIQVQSNNFWDSHGVNLFFISFNNNLTWFWLFSRLWLVIKISFWVGNIWKIMLIINSNLMFWHKITNWLYMCLQALCSQLWNLNLRNFLFLCAGCFFRYEFWFRLTLFRRFLNILVVNFLDFWYFILFFDNFHFLNLTFRTVLYQKWNQICIFNHISY